MKKIIAVIISISVLIGVCCFSVSAADAVNGNMKTIKITDNFEWGTAYMYAEDADGSALCGEWPGAITETEINEFGENKFVCYVPENAEYFVITGVANEAGKYYETEPISDFDKYDGYWLDGIQDEYGRYKVTGYRQNGEPEPDPSDPVGGACFFYNSLCFEQVYEYACDAEGNALLGEWPGRLLTNKEFDQKLGCDRYVLVMPEGTAGVIISSGRGYQTEEITDYSVIQSFWLDGSMNAQGHFLVTPYPGYIDPVVENKPGDVNGDNVLDVLDAVEIQKNSVEKIQFTDAQKRTGDYNKDGNCDVLDAVEIQKALVAG